MFAKFLSHQLTDFWRGRNKGGSIVTKIIMMLLMLYFLLVAIGIGFFMKMVIMKFFPGQSAIEVFNGFILYYFLFDFLVRIQLQELPTLSIQPYLTLNIRKLSIVNFLNIKTLFNFFNIAPLFIFLPFCFTEIAGELGTSIALVHGLCIVSLIVFNNFFVLWFKRNGGSNAFFSISGVLVVLILIAADYFKIISVRDFSNYIFTTVSSHSYLAILFVGLSLFAYVLNSRYLLQNLYLEELSVKEQKKTSTDYPFLNRFGRVGQLAANELKLILRNKRSKSAITMSIVFIFYGLLFYKKNLLDNNQFSGMLFAAIFMTGIFQIAYGQFMFAWQSNHFDGLMANRINFTDFIKAKFLLFNIAATLVTMVTLLYGFISWKLILLHISVYLYNIGFGSVIVLYFANFNKKRLDLSKGGSFNWQGVGATQWILALPLILIPFLIYLPFGIKDKPFWGLIAIGTFGLITLAMQQLWIKWLTNLFIKQRYKIAEGFRE